MDFTPDIISRMSIALHGIFMGMNLHRYPQPQRSDSFSAENCSLTELNIIRRAGRNNGMIELFDIRTSLQLPNSTLTGIVKRLVRHGLVEKIQSTKDGRYCILKLTPFGYEIDKQHRRMEQEIAKNFISHFKSEEEVELFIRLAMEATREPLISTDFLSTNKEDLL